MLLKVINQTRGVVLAERTEIADTWLSRLRGLLFRDKLAPRDCLILHPCNSVHTCFMRFNIDVLFVDRDGRVVYLWENVPPFRFSPVIRTARFVVELPANTIEMTGTLPNDQVNIVEEVAR